MNVIFPIQAEDTALHYAAKYSHLKVLEMLLDKQAPIDEQNKVSEIHSAGIYNI